MLRKFQFIFQSGKNKAQHKAAKTKQFRQWISQQGVRLKVLKWKQHVKVMAHFSKKKRDWIPAVAVSLQQPKVLQTQTPAQENGVKVVSLLHSSTLLEADQPSETDANTQSWTSRISM